MTKRYVRRGSFALWKRGSSMRRKQLGLSVLLLSMITIVSGCTTSSLSGDYCRIAPALTPKSDTAQYVYNHDAVFMEQIIQHWALLDQCD